MDAFRHVFPYEKSVMLNILYDTLDSIGFTIESANSERGTIIVLSSEPTGYCMRIALNSYPSEKKSVIEIFPDIKNNISEDLSKMLLDEIKATIIRSQSITMLNN